MQRPKSFIPEVWLQSLVFAVTKKPSSARNDQSFISKDLIVMFYKRLHAPVKDCTVFEWSLTIELKVSLFKPVFWIGIYFRLIHAILSWLREKSLSNSPIGLFSACNRNDVNLIISDWTVRFGQTHLHFKNTFIEIILVKYVMF